MSDIFLACSHRLDGNAYATQNIDKIQHSYNI
jgi:hypothetical protein